MASDKRNFGQRMQDFMSSYRGKVILNYAYSWGAAIVIAGTLFKLTHLPGANLMLWIGMGTEVLVFFVSAFDLPRKTPTAPAQEAVQGSVSGVVVMGGGIPAEGGIASVPSPGSEMPAAPIQGGSNSPAGPVIIGGGASSGPAVVPQPVNAEMDEATQAYVEKLKETTDMLARFTAQAESFAQNAGQMSDLGRNLAGINAMYEMQLRSASAQMNAVDQVHEQTRKMAKQIEELNAVYARMLEAVQVKV